MKYHPLLREALIEAGGAYFALSRNTIAFFPRDSRHLIITFDDLSVSSQENRDSAWGQKFVQSLGAAHLGIVSDRRDWYGAPDLEEFLISLSEDGFFEAYDKVTLYGVSMGAFGALLFSRLIPGCIVVAFSPQTTLDTDIIPTEDRWKSGKKYGNWKTRKLSDASEGLESARQIYVLTDPFDTHEVHQVERLPDSKNITLLNLWHSGHFILSRMVRWGIARDLIPKMIAGELEEREYYSRLRERRGIRQWIFVLYKKALDKQKFRTALRIIDWTSNNLYMPALRLQKKEIEHKLGDANLSPIRLASPQGRVDIISPKDHR